MKNWLSLTDRRLWLATKHCTQILAKQVRGGTDTWCSRTFPLPKGEFSNHYSNEQCLTGNSTKSTTVTVKFMAHLSDNPFSFLLPTPGFPLLRPSLKTFTACTFSKNQKSFSWSKLHYKSTSYRFHSKCLIFLYTPLKSYQNTIK